MSVNSSSAPVDADIAIPAQMTEALALIERIGGVELLGKVTDLFRNSANDRMTKLQDAANASDRTQVSRLAHAMKGSAAQVGAESLRVRAARLEQEASTISSDELRAIIEEIARATQEAHAQLSYMCSHGRTHRGDQPQ